MNEDGIKIGKGNNDFRNLKKDGHETEEYELRKVQVGYGNKNAVGSMKSTVEIKITRPEDTPRKKSIRALEIFRVQKLILNATSRNESLASHDL